MQTDDDSSGLKSGSKSYDGEGKVVLATADEAQAHHNSIVNASGHQDELVRHYGLFAICATALSIDSAWFAFGGSVVVAIYNGGAPGVIYELLTACAWYGLVAICIAEFASSIPSSGGVYHYATALGGKKYGPVLGYFTGALSWAAWVFDACAICQIPANVLIQMWAIHHPTYVSQTWHVYVCYLIVCWTSIAFVVLGNALLPNMQRFSFFILIGSFVATIAVLAAMPKSHASNAFVWKDFVNSSGYGSNGVCFMTGVLNGAFTIGTPDSVTHMAEELPNPRVDLPKAIAAQMILGTLTSFLYAVALMYSITDLGSILDSVANFPVANIYLQATKSQSATTGLLFMFLLALWMSLVGAVVTCGRSYWTLSRDGAAPFSRFFGRANRTLSCPVESTILQGVLISAFGAIQLGSTTGFTDLVGAFILLSVASYTIPTAAHVLTKRQAIPQGPFWLGKYGYAINISSVLISVMFMIFFCFPFALPVTTNLMNYGSVILVGYTFLASIWWFAIRKSYTGPRLAHLAEAGQKVLDPI